MVGSSTSPSKRAFPVLALAAVGLVGLVGTAGPVGAGVGDGMSLDEVKCQNGSTIVVTFVGNSSGQTQQFDVRLDGTRSFANWPLSLPTGSGGLEPTSVPGLVAGSEHVWVMYREGALAKETPFVAPECADNQQAVLPEPPSSESPPPTPPPVEAVPGLSKPGKVAGLTARVKKGNLKLSWDRTPRAEFYLVKVGRTAKKTAKPRMAIKVKSGEKLIIKVRASNNAGLGPWTRTTLRPE